MLLRDKTTILFQGDSVTDAGRSKENLTDLGPGYPNLIANAIAAEYPNLDIHVINRGISGNRVADLKNRWTRDCIELKPDIVTILIGINNTWRRYDRNDPTSLEDYQNDYHEILTRVKNETNAIIIMMEPFLLQTKEDKMVWREDLDPKITAIRRLAIEFGAIYIPLDGIFAAASTQQPPAVWSADGVHPTPAGHGLIAKEWLRVVK